MLLIETAAPSKVPLLPLADDAPLPEGPALLSADRLLAGEIKAHPEALGVLWPNDRDVALLAPFLQRLALVALVFPKFRDGRAFSQARLLRERYGFKGQIRATGNVLQDQILMMARSGFDAFALEKPEDAAAFAQALSRYSVFYQPAADHRPTARDARLRAAQEEARP